MARADAIWLELREVPKPTGEMRVLTALAPVDAERYAGVVASVAPLIAVSRDPGVHGPGTGGLVVARRRWRLAAGALGGGGVAVRSDVRACYESIRPTTAASGLLAAGCHPHDVERVVAFLSQVEGRGTPGLPVGPVPSAMLAQAVLALGDRAVRAAGGSIVRWVDDVAIGGEDRASALRAFDAWRGCLRSLGLEPHEGKTVIGEDAREASPHPSGPGSVPRGMMRAP